MVKRKTSIPMSLLLCQAGWTSSIWLSSWRDVTVCFARGSVGDIYGHTHSSRGRFYYNEVLKLSFEREITWMGENARYSPRINTYNTHARTHIHNTHKHIYIEHVSLSYMLYENRYHPKQLEVFSELINIVPVRLSREYCIILPVNWSHIQLTIMIIDSEQAHSSPI